jgi:hypothetical protein
MEDRIVDAKTTEQGMIDALEALAKADKNAVFAESGKQSRRQRPYA